MIAAHHAPASSASLRAEHYAGGARYALAQAKTFRDLARNGGAQGSSTSSPQGSSTSSPQVDRHLMRGFALAWRHFTARARELSAGLPS